MDAIDDPGRVFLWFPTQTRDEARAAAGVSADDKSLAIRIVPVKAQEGKRAVFGAA